MFASTLSVLVVLTAGPDVPPVKHVRLAMSSLVGVGLAAGAPTAIESRFAQALTGSDRRLEVLLSRDVSAVLGQERERQLLGCDEDACLSELVGALDAQGILVGDVSVLGSTTVFNIRVIDGRNARTVASRSVSAPTLDALLPLVDQVATELRGELLFVYFGERPKPAAKSPLPWVVVGVGSVVTLVGAGLVVGGNLRANDAVTLSPTNPPSLVRRELNGAATTVNAGLIVGAVGLAAVVGGVIWGASRPALAFVPNSHGGVVVLSGALP